MRKDKIFVLEQLEKECEDMHLDLQAEALKEKWNMEDGE